LTSFTWHLGAADVEAYKARKLREGRAPKSVNNHLTVLRKLLNLAVEWGELRHAPRVKALRVAPSDFQFLTFEETERFLRTAAPEWRPAGGKPWQVLQVTSLAPFMWAPKGFTPFGCDTVFTVRS
jgi:integrase